MAKPEPKRWGQAVLGGLLLALGGVLFGAARAGEAEHPRSAARQRRGKAAGPQGKSPRAGTARPKGRTRPRTAEVPVRTRHWPPPDPEPIAPDGGAPRSGAGDRPERLPVGRESQRLGYEVADTKAGAVAKVMVLSLALIVASIAGLFWFIGEARRTDALSPPLTRQQLAAIVPPAPHLQDHPLDDIAMERKREEELLTTYAWTDRSRQAARIPIARAEALVVGRPLDPTPAASAAPAPPP